MGEVRPRGFQVMRGDRPTDKQTNKHADMTKKSTQYDFCLPTYVLFNKYKR